jgi:hypothetical protein
MMVRSLCLIAVVAGSIAMQSCAVDNEDTFRTSGIIALRSGAMDFSGYYYIIADNGIEYFPLNLGDEFHHAGMRIRFEALEHPKPGPIAGWGNHPVIELVHIEKI